MSIRVKLIATYLAVALLVPVLGGVTMSRVSAVDGSIGALGRDAVPALAAVKALEQSHAEQSTAVLTFLVGGDPAERQRFLDRSQEFDRNLKKLLPPAAGTGRPDRRSEAARKVADERTAFVAAAGQVVSARGVIDRDLDELRRKHDEIVQALGLLRRRVTGGADVTALPASLRREHGDLLLGAAGMLEVVHLEHTLATSYALRPDESVRRRFESAGLAFSTWLQLATAAGTTEDRQALARAQSMFFQDFEPRARSLFLAADFAAQARAVFATASAGLAEQLAGMAVESATVAAAASGDAETASERAAVVVVLITLVAFLLAGLLGLWFSGTITRPIIQLRNAADRLSRGDASNVDLQVTSNDEVGDLARAFRRMALSIRILTAGPAGEARQGAPRP